jgi:hypothetical protein
MGRYPEHSMENFVPQIYFSICKPAVCIVSVESLDEPLCFVWRSEPTLTPNSMQQARECRQIKWLFLELLRMYKKMREICHIWEDMNKRHTEPYPSHKCKSTWAMHGQRKRIELLNVITMSTASTSTFCGTNLSCERIVFLTNSTTEPSKRPKCVSGLWKERCDSGSSRHSFEVDDAFTFHTRSETLHQILTWKHSEMEEWSMYQVSIDKIKHTHTTNLIQTKRKKNNQRNICRRVTCTNNDGIGG